MMRIEAGVVGCFIVSLIFATALRADPFQLSDEHVAAAGRDRRIIICFDTISGDRRFGGRDPAELVKWKFHVIDSAGVQIDSVWWGWGEGNQSPWPSETMPLYDAEGYRKWAREGVDIAAIFAAESSKRGIESFYHFRINGSDNDLGPFRKIPLKLEHPEWLIHTWPGPVGYWNYAIPEVREYKLSILGEIAERFDYDGISLDFARVCPVLPPGQAWALRDKLTEFMREFRAITLEVARKRGRPLLIGVRIPENLEGCHFDGLDIETWLRENLVDVLALGVRSFDVDLPAFGRLVAGTHVKLYPSIDDHHASDGYATPPIEIYRGVATNWWRQGADGIQTFNFNHAPDFPYRGVWPTHRMAYREIGSPDTLRFKDKIFVVQRRGGGHGPSVIPNPEDWTTPRWMYMNTNMLAPLPARLAGDGRADTLLTISIGDDVSAERDRLGELSVRVLLSDPAAREMPAAERLARVMVATIGHPDGGLRNDPPARGIEAAIELRLNNVLLEKPIVREGWIVFPDVSPDLFAPGENLVGLRLTDGPRKAPDEILVEKLEVEVKYRPPEFRVVAGQRQLFLDDHGIAAIDNLERTMHRPQKRGAVIRSPNAAQVIQTRAAPAWDPDAGLYKLWVIGIDEALWQSADGLHWTPGATSAMRVAMAVYDPLDPDPSRRFKAALGNRGFAVSPDGSAWTKLDVPAIPSFDESNFSHDPAHGLFIHTVKRRGPYGRSVALATSRDFQNWTDHGLIFHTDEIDQELGRKNIAARKADPTLQQSFQDNPADYNVDVYNMGVFHYEGLYIGLPALYHAAGRMPNYPNTDGFHLVQLTCSRDLKNWTRLGDRQPFIGPSRRDSGAHDLTQILSPSAPVVRGDELWFYYTGLKYRGAWRYVGTFPDGEHVPLPGLDSDQGAVCLAVLRRDGFISLDAGSEPGTITTAPFTLPAGRLLVNLDALGGELRVEVLDAEGRTLARSRPLSADLPRGGVEWEDGDFAALAGKIVSLEFTLGDASLYSFWLEG